MERLSMYRLLVEAQYIVTIGYGESYSMGMPSWRNNVPHEGDVVKQVRIM
jgi:hypothetical protein